MTNPDIYRAGLPPIPPRLLGLPVSRGYPVPWFVAQLADGSYDFRVADGRKIRAAVEYQRCYVCGHHRGAHMAFTIGPMCAVNRIAPEPPSHVECAQWSAVACPFLNQTEQRRRTGGMPDGATMPAGEMIARQPGVVLVWVTKSYQLVRDGDGILFRIGEPVQTRWYREGRAATRAEILESITSGYPLLMAAAEQDGPSAVRMLETMRDRAMAYVPGA